MIAVGGFGRTQRKKNACSENRYTTQLLQSVSNPDMFDLNDSAYLASDAGHYFWLSSDINLANRICC